MSSKDSLKNFKIIDVVFLDFFGLFLKSLEKRKKHPLPPQHRRLLVIFFELITWGAQGQMTQFNLIVNSLPRDLLEFTFFLVVGFTAGTIGII